MPTTDLPDWTEAVAPRAVSTDLLGGFVLLSPPDASAQVDISNVQTLHWQYTPQGGAPGNSVGLEIVCTEGGITVADALIGSWAGFSAGAPSTTVRGSLPAVGTACQLFSHGSPVIPLQVALIGDNRPPTRSGLWVQPNTAPSGLMSEVSGNIAAGGNSGTIYLPTAGQRIAWTVASTGTNWRIEFYYPSNYSNAPVLETIASAETTTDTHLSGVVDVPPGALAYTMFNNDTAIKTLHSRVFDVTV